LAGEFIQAGPDPLKRFKLLAPLLDGPKGFLVVILDIRSHTLGDRQKSSKGMEASQSFFERLAGLAKPIGQIGCHRIEITDPEAIQLFAELNVGRPAIG
jgi:hypothetical protein